jgi:PAS domain S-box-containing protein
MATVKEPTMDKALQEANARLRLLIESVQGGLTIFEGNRAVYVSNQLCQILGYSREELGRMSELDFAAPEEMDRLELTFQEAQQMGLPLEELEFWAVRKDGSRCFVRNRYSTGIVGAGTPFRFVVTLDLTERELARQAVLERDELLQHILDTSQALAAADGPEAMLRAIAEPVMRAASGIGAGAHVAMLMYIDVDAEGRPEWARVVASVGEAAVPEGIRFYLPGTSPTDLLLSSPDRPLLVADMRASMEGMNEHVARMMESIHARAFVALPLRVGKRWQGIAAIAWPEVHEFRPEEERLYQLLASELTGRVQGLRQREEAEHRAMWSQTAVEVSQAASTVLEMEELLQQVVNLVQARFELYYAGLFLVAQEVTSDGESGNWAVLQVGTGEAGRQMVEQGHKLEIGGESMIGRCVATKQPRIAMDVGEEAVRFANPLLPDTRTELALPLVSRGQALGALTIQSRRQAVFSVDDIAVLQTMADQLAITIDNANLIEQAHARAEREKRVRAIADQIHRGASAEIILRSTLAELNQMLGASKSVIRLGTQARLRAELGELLSEEE